MGCDIHCVAEKRQADGSYVALDFLVEEVIGDKWKYSRENPFGNRNYGVFGFFADVRNYSAIPPIASPRGFPPDASDSTRQAYEAWGVDAHTPSYLMMEELNGFDYDVLTEDRRFTRQEGPNFFNGAATAEEGEGVKETYREFLSAGSFFEDFGLIIN